ncbi:Microcystin-dependent protein [Lishizhenia tianjinensis]|uniref:Microcystin-dependent protein n=1 Tax=Lishizhenia tianjinensis TaxID=477690 RepID=A0A1I7BK06_9FLAO|nr:tail fiber protein [Lishizhenia tianjinensis]SFT87514.1 Microcystin-dependent protein [Lishizhenia tianjinensis]
MEPFIGQIIMFGGNFAPRGWAFCDGQILPIATNQVLYSILGNEFGGDGRTTFALPDLRGRAPIGPRTGPGLSTYCIGEKGGVEDVTLNIQQMPSHSHMAQTTADLNGQSTPGDEDVLSPEVVLASGSGTSSEIYSSSPANTKMGNSISATTTLANSGGSQSHENMQPYLAVNYIIAIDGEYPIRS